jgi:hypothetical protein
MRTAGRCKEQTSWRLVRNEVTKRTNALDRAQAQHALLDVCSWLLNGSQIADAQCTCAMSLKARDLRKLLDTRVGDVDVSDLIDLSAIQHCKVHGRASAAVKLAMPTSLPFGLRSASPALCSALLSAVSAYLPSSTDGSNERSTLTSELLRLANDATVAPLEDFQASPHPMRAVALVQGLDSCIWKGSTAAPIKQNTHASSAKGAGVFAFNADSFYSLSHDADKVNWFVSHGAPLR